MSEMPTPPDNSKWFLKLMPDWLKNQAVKDGVDLQSVGIVELLWIAILNDKLNKADEEKKS